jgi:hypothetical protein
MSGQSEHYGNGDPMIHSCSVIFKRCAYFSFIDFIIEKMQKSTSASYSPEGLLTEWILKNDIKYKHAPIQPTYTSGEFEGRHDTYCEEGGPSTWKDILGFRNIIAEKSWRCTNRKPPLDKKYFELKHLQHWNDHDKKTLYQYYITGDYRYIKLGWDQDPYLPRPIRLERKNFTIDDYDKENV